MGYDATWDGQVTITPPLTWPEIKNAPKLRDLELVRDETAVDTATGQTATITAKVIQPRSDWGAYAGGSIEPELNMLLTAFPGHEFTGAITADGPEGNHWRYVIRGREVVYETPRIIWPDDEQRVTVDRLAMVDVLATALDDVRHAAPGLDLDVERDRRFIATALAGPVATHVEEAHRGA